MSAPQPVAVIGRYALYDEIAAGGMATVHMGRLLGPVGFARTVAVKRLHPQYAKDPEFVSMFLDEARLAARIRHPNVVPTLDVVALTGELFLVMDYVHGVPLSRLMRGVLEKETRIPPEIVAHIIVDALHGLHAAHEAKSERGLELGIVHRDVSPQNIMVGSDGLARVLDFGVAKATWRIQTTRDGQVKGKLAYMAPEQVTGGDVGPWTDVYAMGIVLWESLTGQRLFNKSDGEGLLARFTKNEPIAAPSTINRQLPAHIDAVVLKALAHDVKNRFASAQDMADAIESKMRVASSSAVGRWVQQLAQEELQQNAKRIAEIESCSSVSTRPPFDSPSVRGLLAAARARSESDSGGTSPAEERTVSVTGSSAAASEYSSRSQISMTRSPTFNEQLAPRRKRMLFIGAGVGVAALLLILISVTRGTSNGALAEPGTTAIQPNKGAVLLAHADQTVPTPARDAQDQPKNPEPAQLVVADPKLEPQVVEPETLTEETTAKKAVRTTSPRVRQSTPVQQQPVATTAKVTAGCNPPYIVDSRGIRHMKIACLRK
jgi:serine/threonine-protein kinase